MPSIDVGRTVVIYMGYVYNYYNYMQVHPILVTPAHSIVFSSSTLKDSFYNYTYSQVELMLEGLLPGVKADRSMLAI